MKIVYKTKCGANNISNRYFVIRLLFFPLRIFWQPCIIILITIVILLKPQNTKRGRKGVKMGVRRIEKREKPQQCRFRASSRKSLPTLGCNVERVNYDILVCIFYWCSEQPSFHGRPQFYERSYYSREARPPH